MLGTMTDADFSVAELADRAAAELAERTGRDHHDVAVVLGSGWRPAADVLCSRDGVKGADGPDGLTEFTEFPMSDLPGFLPPTAEGHGGTVRSLRIGGLNVLVLLGRTHAYEGHALWRTAHAVRTAAAAGVSTVVLTNAAGVEVLGISLVTNLAAGITGEPLNHEEVLAAGAAAATDMGTLLGELITEMNTDTTSDTTTDTTKEQA